MKKIIDLLGIILPALIILLGLIRLFVKNTKGVSGLTMFFAIILLLTGLLRYFVFPDRGNGSSDPKPEPLKVSKHSDAFNQSIENVLASYQQLTESLIANDTTAINQAGKNLKASLDSVKVEELKVDSAIYETAMQPYDNTRAEAGAVATDPSVAEKKASFNILSNELFTFLLTVKYDLAKLYWQECESAFGEGKPGNWISKTEKSSNPYIAGDCAEIKTTINNLPKDTTKQTK